MGVHHHGQVFGVAQGLAHGQREVTLDAFAVARGVLDGEHFGHLLLFDPRAEFGQFGHRVGLGVVEVVGARRAVAAGVDDVFVLGLVRTGDDQFVTAQVAFHAAEQLAGLAVEEVARRSLVAFVRYAEQFFLLFAVPDALQVVGVVRVEHLFLLARRGVHQHEGILVASEVGDGVHHPVVGGERREVDPLLEVGRQHGAELVGLGLAVADLGVHAVDDGVGYAQTAVVVGLPALHVAGVFAKQGFLPRVEVQAVGIEYLRVALVRPDDHQRIDLLQRVDDRGLHAREGGVGLRIRAVDVDAVELEILVAARVLEVEDAAVVGPEVPGQVAFGLRGDSHGLVRADLLYEDVAAALPGGHVGEVPAVGRNLVARLFRVAEEGLHRQLGSSLRSAGDGRGGHCGDDKEFFHGFYLFEFSSCLSVLRQMFVRQSTSTMTIGRSNPCGDWGNIRCVATFTAKAATTRKMVRMRMTFSISMGCLFCFRHRKHTKQILKNK